MTNRNWTIAGNKNWFKDPAKWKRPCMVRIEDDLFDPTLGLKNETLDALFGLIAMNPQHIFQICTGFVGFSSTYCNFFFGKLGLTTLPNVWLGLRVSTQNEVNLFVPALFDIPAALWFLDIDQMSEPIDLKCQGVILPDGNLTGCDSRGGVLTDCPHCEGTDTWLNRIDWVGCHLAENGNVDWAKGVRDQCSAAGVPFTYLGRLGEKNRLLDGREWNEKPALDAAKRKAERDEKFIRANTKGGREAVQWAVDELLKERGSE